MDGLFHLANSNSLAFTYSDMTSCLGNDSQLASLTEQRFNVQNVIKN